MNYFLDSKEGNKHLKSKQQLFNILSKGNIKIYNHQLKRIDFDITKGFLQMESFLLCDKKTKDYNYINEPLYNNTEHICREYLEKNTYNCDFNNQSKVTENLPCVECINKNDLIGDFGIGYTPDIAYIEDNKHKIWFEINNSHPCTPEKKRFCRDNNIILLELDAQNFRDNISNIYFNELNFYDYEDSRNKELIAQVYNIINEKGFATIYDLETRYNISYALYEDFVAHYDLVYLHIYDRYIANCIGYKKERPVDLIIDNKTYKSIFDNYTYSKEKHLEDTLEILEVKIKEGLDKYGYYKQADAFAFIEEMYYRTSPRNMIDIVDELSEKMGLVNTQDYDKNKVIIKGKPKLILPKEYLKEINQKQI